MVLLIVVAFLASALLTALVKSYLLRRRVLDIPNERSSHVVPTPRGGGISIVLVFFCAVLFLVRCGIVSEVLALALSGGIAVALVGLLDDHRRVSAWTRLLTHFAAAEWALWRLGGVAPLHLGVMSWDWGWVGHIGALVGLVWMINLYNFMDGIDGIAGSEAASASGLAGLLLVWNGLIGLAACAFALTGATAGFLVWNWAPAKIFLGDVGSGFLGFVFGVLIISSTRERSYLLWPWLILLLVFIVDSTLTLVRRFALGARWYDPHRSHAYQNAARYWGSHSKITLTIVAINTVWLFPLGYVACVRPTVGPLIAVLALIPLVNTAIRYNAGVVCVDLPVRPS